MDLIACLKQWTIFGPIDNPGAYPGQRGWTQWPLDGAATIPGSLTLEGKTYSAVPAQLIDQTLDFRTIFGTYPTGAPQAYALCQFDVTETLQTILCMDADWGATIWLDGHEILNTQGGSPSPMGFFPTRARLTLQPGRHTLNARIISGQGSWTLKLLTQASDRLKRDRPSYLEAGLRLEERPRPTGRVAGLETEVFEKLAVTCGVEARWISVFDQERLELTGNVMYNSTFLPTGEGYKPEFEDRLRQWVKAIHELHVPVVSWSAMTLNRQGWLDHPEWRQVYLVDQTENILHDGIDVCINTPYGDALINCCLEAIRKFDLDGFWFDGAAMSNVWTQPYRISCVCPYCKAKYERETGNRVPMAYEPEKREFREWMAWRYRSFSEYWIRLTAAIKTAHPQAVVAINHYHREHIPWNGAVPLNPFGTDIISATEADGDPWKAAFYTRINRAYGRPYSETWLCSAVGRYTTDGIQQHNPYPLITHAVSCLTAGADSSFGGVDLVVSAKAYAELANEIQPRKPYRYLPSHPFLAFHVSQQTATYTFGTNPDFIKPHWHDHYWKSLVGWHRLLMTAGLWMEVMFDDHLTLDRLRPYPYFVMPYAVALSDAQVAVLLEYARGGGTLLAGPYFATQDEWGFAKDRAAPLTGLLPGNRGFPAFADLAAIMAASGKPGCRKVKLGAGSIVQFDGDPGAWFRDKPSLAAVEMIWRQIPRARVPVSLETADGQPAYAHLGVSRDPDGNVIVAIQQLEPFWDAKANLKSRPPLIHDAKLKVTLPGVKAARCLIPEPGFDLDLRRRGKTVEMKLPPYTWGVHVKLILS